MSDTVVQTEHLDPEAAAWLAQRCRLVRCAREDPRFAEVAAGAAGLVVRTYTRVDGALLDKTPRLRVVGRAGAGLDNVDVPACRARGVEVVYTPDANTQAVVEFVFALIASVLRPARQIREAVSLDRWKALRRHHPDRPQMSELALGILGLGRIGRRVAQAGRALGFARVLYNDLLEIPPDQRFGARPVTVRELFEQADVLTVHVDGRAENRDFVGESLLELAKPGVILINTSRGFVVDSLALARFLGRHPGALAMLDVHEPEPFGPDYPLLGLDNARLTPHLAAATNRADLQMSWVVRDVAAVLEGARPQYPAP